jgi:hypothetical protein
VDTQNAARSVEAVGKVVWPSGTTALAAFAENYTAVRRTDCIVLIPGPRAVRRRLATARTSSGPGVGQRRTYAVTPARGRNMLGRRWRYPTLPPPSASPRSPSVVDTAVPAKMEQRACCVRACVSAATAMLLAPLRVVGGSRGPLGVEAGLG